MGRYVFTPEIFDAIDRVTPDAGGEIQLTDAIALLLDEQAVYGYCFADGRYDIGKKLDYLRATVEMAIDRDDLGPEFRAFLTEFVQGPGPGVIALQEARAYVLGACTPLPSTSRADRRGPRAAWRSTRSWRPSRCRRSPTARSTGSRCAPPTSRARRARRPAGSR